MDADSLHALEIACWAMMAVFGLRSGALRTRDAWQLDEYREAARARYRRIRPVSAITRIEPAFFAKGV